MGNRTMRNRISIYQEFYRFGTAGERIAGWPVRPGAGIVAADGCDAGNLPAVCCSMPRASGGSSETFYGESDAADVGLAPAALHLAGGVATGVVARCFTVGQIASV